MVKKTVKELTLHVEGDTQFVDIVFMDGSELGLKGRATGSQQPSAKRTA